MSRFKTMYEVKVSLPLYSYAWCFRDVTNLQGL